MKNLNKREGKKIPPPPHVTAASTTAAAAIIAIAPSGTVAAAAAATATAPPPPPLNSAFDQLLSSAESTSPSSTINPSLATNDFINTNATVIDLGRALAARGAKAGGTWAERASRLLLILGLRREDIPKKLRANA